MAPPFFSGGGWAPEKKRPRDRRQKKIAAKWGALGPHMGVPGVSWGSLGPPVEWGAVGVPGDS